MKPQTCSRPLGCANCGLSYGSHFGESCGNGKEFKPSHDHSPRGNLATLNPSNTRKNVVPPEGEDRDTLKGSAGTHSPFDKKDTPEDDNNLIRKRSESNSEKREFVMGRSVSESSGTHSSDKEYYANGSYSKKKEYETPNYPKMITAKKKEVRPTKEEVMERESIMDEELKKEVRA